MFEKSRTKGPPPQPDSGSDSDSNYPSDASGEKPASVQASTYKCASCGKTLTGGPALYCDGCGQYYCYPCGVASGDMIWNCPNCAIEAQRVNL